MSKILNVDLNEEYTIPLDETEEYSQADIDGTLQLNGTLRLVENPDTGPDIDSLINPNNFSLPLVGIIITLIFSFVVMAVKFRSAIIFFCVTALIITVLFSILLGLSFIWVWLVCLITAIMVSVISITSYLL